MAGSLACVSTTIIIWIVLRLMIVGLRMSWGRNLYALGGNRGAAKLLGVSELKYWVAVGISGIFAALTERCCWVGRWCLHSVGDPYLFTAPAVIGGTSLLGGNGGYGHGDWSPGPAGPDLLTSCYRLQYEWQQFMLAF